MNSAKFSKVNPCSTRLDQHCSCLQIRLNAFNRRSQCERNSLLPRALSISTPSEKSCGAVLILPGFLYGSKPYQGLVNSLQQRGYTAAVVPISPKDWWPILIGSDFQWYLKKLDTALTELYNKHGSVALVGHSAGGWLARILLGEDVSYQGLTFPGRRKKVHALITLGTPHASVEAYPLGRVAEKLVIDPETVIKFKTGKTPSGSSSSSSLEANAAGAASASAASSTAMGEVVSEELMLPEGVKGSSLQFANYFYPDASCLPGVQVVCLVGNAITGQTPIWRDGNNTTASNNFKNPIINKIETSQQREIITIPGAKNNTNKYDAWVAYEGYKSGCGDGAVPGDGVTPLCIAHLPGAENIVLPGVWHGPKSKLPERPWYGDEVVLDNTWVKYLDIGYSAP